jgi:hypothetical protein
MLMHRVRGSKLPFARFSLGKWGPLINILGLIYILPIFIFSFFPSAPNPVPATMNWAVVMLGGVIILATVHYFTGGQKKYTPPHETVDDYIERCEATTASEKTMSSGVAEEKAASDTVAEQSLEGEKKAD